jgi:FkbM family methyltransferase
MIAELRENLYPLVRWKRSAGLLILVRWNLLRMASKIGFSEPPTWNLQPLTARLRGSSDMQVFEQIFLYEEYSCLDDLEDPVWILDLGSNVGYTSAYLLSHFPKVRVIAVEPDGRNVAICRNNLSPYGDRARILHGAVWSESTELRLITGAFRDGLEWSTQVGELVDSDATTETIKAWDVGSLIDMNGGAMLDLLKVDIEGAELTVFGDTAQAWLHRVKNICIELHGDECKEVFFRALEGFDYDLHHFGELTICRNLQSKTGPR